MRAINTNVGIAFAAAALTTLSGCAGRTSGSGDGGAGASGASNGGSAGSGTGGSAGAGTGGTGTGGAGAGGGSGGSDTGGTGGISSCGDLGHACTPGQLCVEMEEIGFGASQPVSWKCAADECAPRPLACDCVGWSICSEGITGFVQGCQVGAPGDAFDLMCMYGFICASPDTPIATPDGERHIASLRAGDLVYSVDHGVLRVVPLLRTSRRPVIAHHVVHLVLATGATLDISPRHPTADGRTFADLRAGATLDGVAITSATLVAYDHDATYDILPASDSGGYFAGGVLVGSTLARHPALVTRPTAPSSAAR